MAFLSRPLWHSLSFLGIVWVLIAPQPPMPESTAFAGESPLILSGRIQKLQGNRQPGPDPMPAPGPVSGQEIVVVLGRIQPVQLGDPFLTRSQPPGSDLEPRAEWANGIFSIAGGPPVA